MENAITAVLAEVSPRLKRARAQRGITLTELAAATGISKSTLSRLEAGQRKPSLELLLPIARAHRIPLDELVGAPDVGDPRIRLTPRNRNGRIVVPLTRQPGGPQAWKVIIRACIIACSAYHRYVAGSGRGAGSCGPQSPK